jgi:hypothetical protein
MNNENIHNEKFDRIHEGHYALIKSIKEYIHTRESDAEVGEITIQYNHKMICIAPSTNRGPFWAVEGIPAWFSLQVSQKFNYPMRIYTIGYCLKIHSGSNIIRMLITDERSDICGREILIHINHIGRYFLMDKSDEHFKPTLQLIKYPTEEQK